jgi:amino-acid N-acetyltransferase
VIPQPAQLRDLEGIHALLRSQQLPHTDLTATHLHHFHVLRDGDRVDGVIGLEICGEHGLLRSLAVAPAARRSGHGTMLLASAERDAAMLELRSLFLLTTGAAAFFEQRGYRPTPRSQVPPEIAATTEFSALCPASAICLMRAVAGRSVDKARSP